MLINQMQAATLSRSKVKKNKTCIPASINSTN